MKNRQLSCLLLFFALLFSPFSYSDSDDLQVANWTEQVLLKTLSISYQTTPDDFALLKQNFLNNAWLALSNFLSEELETLRDQQLTLHPAAIEQAQVVNSGYVSGIHFWRVNQTISLPELSLAIAFSVIVIKRNGTPPYVIQSIDMTKAPFSQM
ncbi:hypothetical protein [Legionella fairfieldensis]|uniref:hypothetical protein n=1 Tax=Legionella fairfieldensis TaxID=45064 RepID=UPI000688C017|nr:hypothetical protein [Legionella fairfieldensis]